MIYLIFITIVFSFEIFLIHLKLNGTHQHKKPIECENFYEWMSTHINKASSFGIGNQLINQSINQSINILGMQIEPKAHETIMARET